MTTTPATPTRLITVDEVTEALNTVVDSKPPDYRNPYCQYTNLDGTPCCIIGNVLEELGLPRPQFGEMENTQTIRTLDLDLPFESSAWSLLDVVQHNADFPHVDSPFHIPWSQCLPWRQQPS